MKFLRDRPDLADDIVVVTVLLLLGSVFVYLIRH